MNRKKIICVNYESKRGSMWRNRRKVYKTMENKGKNKSNFTWIKENFEEYKNKT